MRTDAVRLATNSSHARSLLCATKASESDQSTLPPWPDGTTRLPSRRPRALCGGGSAQPIKGYSSEITARDSLRPRVVKSQPVIKRTRLPHRRRRPASAAGWLATTLCKTVANLAIERASCQALCRWRSTQTDGLWVAWEHPSCVRGCNPTGRPDAERRRRVTASSNRKSCALAGPRSRVAGARAACTGLWRVHSS